MDTAIDSQIMSFLLKRNPPTNTNKSQDVNEMYKRSRFLINKLDREKTEVFLPTVVVSELLIGVDSSKHIHFISELQTRFKIIPYDVRATSIAAELWRINHEIPEEDKIERRYIKSDILIIATVKAHKIRVLYSHDRKCRNLAEKIGIKGLNLPESSEYLFDTGEDQPKT